MRCHPMPVNLENTDINQMLQPRGKDIFGQPQFFLKLAESPHIVKCFADNHQAPAFTN